MDPANVIWDGPLLNASGYGEESRALLLAAHAAGVPIAAQNRDWSDNALLSPEESAVLKRLLERQVRQPFVQVVHDLGWKLQRHPQAAAAACRTMFETDRLPRSWVDACNRMDAVWVTGEFNRRTFAAAGVVSDKLRIVPPCLPPEFLLPPSDEERAAAATAGTPKGAGW